MLTFILSVNGKYFTGFSDKCYKSDNNLICRGWQNYNDNNIQIMEFSDDKSQAKEIGGITNLKSYTDALYTRVKDGMIIPDKIEIITKTNC